MYCIDCGKEMESIWCDDDEHTTGFVHTCVCGRRIIEEDGQNPVILEREPEVKLVDKQKLINILEKEIEFLNANNTEITEDYHFSLSGDLSNLRRL